MRILRFEALLLLLNVASSYTNICDGYFLSSKLNDINFIDLNDYKKENMDKAHGIRIQFQYSDHYLIYDLIRKLLGRRIRHN